LQAIQRVKELAVRIEEKPFLQAIQRVKELAVRIEEKPRGEEIFAWLLVPVYCCWFPWLLVPVCCCWWCYLLFLVA